MNKPRIYADFNKLDENRSAILVCKGTLDDVQRLGIVFDEGMAVTLYMPDDVDAAGNPDSLEVDAVLRYDSRNGWWVGVFEWSELGYRSERSVDKGDSV